MNCIICSKKKEDFEVWNNRIIIAATFDSEFQNHEKIRKLGDNSVICHDCINQVKEEIDENRK